jgi:hypothetical protein
MNEMAISSLFRMRVRVQDGPWGVVLDIYFDDIVKN